MSFKLLDGKKVAETIQKDLKMKMLKRHQAGKRIPTLAVIIVGEDSASHVYVKNKEKAAEYIGFHSIIEALPVEITEAELLAEVKRLNHDETVDGILVQLPLPKHIDEEKVLFAIGPEKDVDGFHPLNMGKLMINQPDKLPCTPYGIMTLLDFYDIDLCGCHAVVVGRSNIVGKPIAQMLLNRHATVTVTHSRTENLKELTRQADVLIIAIGQAEAITGDYVKEGAIVIDVGMNRNQLGELVGDVLFEDVAPKTSFITPVPGGVGPMTITMLMEQTIKNANE
ncbi:bifunctional methylenetetrahydrofolate dehydrogenase/methenyltetrahydrofolate cyclohydrolase FolD [Vagococcus sp.]|uniref:bifunctional methylenetetrahydrofolate dehydrogenase/methenyltetrahydrofolate cyclohydrolase FolD n=1 Tax=Vagococcus sp. TaxID=1933889 RepID=UPI003F9B7F22